MDKRLKMGYDKEADILDISLGEHVPAISNEVEDDFFVRINPVTGEVVGFSVLNFEKWFKNIKDVKDLPISAELALLA